MQMDKGKNVRGGVFPISGQLIHGTMGLLCDGTLVLLTRLWMRHGFIAAAEALIY